MILKFPYSASRRIAARRPRRSKNGTPEERAAKAAAAKSDAKSAAANVVDLTRRVTVASITTVPALAAAVLVNIVQIIQHCGVAS